MITEHDPDRTRQRRHLALEQRERIATLMAALPCPECGSRDGMTQWHREDILEPPLASERWYRLHNVPDYLYQTCWQCNPPSLVDDTYTRLTHSQVSAWLADRKGEDHAPPSPLP